MHVEHRLYVSLTHRISYSDDEASEMILLQLSKKWSKWKLSVSSSHPSCKIWLTELLVNLAWELKASVSRDSVSSARAASTRSSSSTKKQTRLIPVFFSQQTNILKVYHKLTFKPSLMNYYIHCHLLSIDLSEVTFKSNQSQINPMGQYCSRINQSDMRTDQKFYGYLRRKQYGEWELDHLFKKTNARTQGSKIDFDFRKLKSTRGFWSIL